MSSRRLVSFRLADDLKKALDERADTEGISTTELVNRLLRKGLETQQDRMQGDSRLSNVEYMVRKVLTRLESETTTQETLLQPEHELAQRLSNLERKVELVSKAVFEIKYGPYAEKTNCNTDSQGDHQAPASLDELWSLIEPKS